MSQIENYKEYKKYQPDYKVWKAERDNKLNQKIEYLKTNPVSADEYNNDVERAKIILNAVNVMDEYSQSRAEEMEQVTEAVSNAGAQVVSYVSMALGGVTLALTKSLNVLEDAFNGNFKNITKAIPAAIAFMAPVAIYGIFSQIWSAKKEVQASRQGRQDAMNDDLASVKQFAVLDESQQAQVEKIAQTINVEDKEAKKIINNQRNLGILSSFKDMFKKEDEKKFVANVEMCNEKLSKKEILEAKKDKDLIQNIVEKIDIASQDYAENAELIVGTLTTVATSGGLVAGFLVNALAKLIKPLAKYSKGAGVAVGALVSVAGIIYGTKIQKQASRVGRFKVKKELLNNPEQLLYVDEEKYKNTKTEAKNKEKRSFIQTTLNLIKDNKEYNEHIKNNNAKEIQKRKAREQITLSKEQENRAKQLQNNIFNMFNKLDEKSQSYSESTEAIGNSITTILTSVFTLPLTMVSMMKGMAAETKKSKLLAFIGFLAAYAVPIIADIIVTKDQKNASRVANMQAIKELDDYRYFAQKNENNEKIGQNKKDSNEIFGKFLNKSKSI